MAVPGSWNEQLAEAGLMNYDSACWYERAFVAPSWIEGRRLRFYFAGAGHDAIVYLNGEEVARSGAALLPFETDVTGRLVAGESATIIVRVDGRLPETGPMQRVTKDDYRREGRQRDEYFPAVRFDFFPFAGLNRSVWLCAEPLCGLTALKATAGADGIVDVAARAPGTSEIRIRIVDGAEIVTAQNVVENGGAAATLAVANPRLWRAGHGALYSLCAEALVGGKVIDRVDLRIGFRTISVDRRGLILNGEPVVLKGFGKHEEGPLRGRGTDLAQIVKDFLLLDWCGANSFRTAHYPYSEEWLDAADEAGVLVISELFCVNLDFRRADVAGLAAHQEALSAQIARDGSHPCVVAWSLANEPGYLGEEEARAPAAREYWRSLYAHARVEDPLRPLTHAHVGYAGDDDPAFAFDDFLSLNRYYGWYQAPGQLDEVEALLCNELDRLANRYAKPILLTEFGADAVPGMHATGDQMFTEEYQAALIERYWRMIETHPCVFGGHVWSFADFRTAQHSRRVVFNFKGVFTRDRAPKAAAWKLRSLWRAKRDGE